ncbi:putative cytochrome P450 hydroxylase [[Actinomadura] parvosata subsp. kistnae]|uniref:Cytochrome n=1 Tax=[Actinomadura] parvosata subsp. kistnae TaxID=1909395 RepID=A0A1V0A3T0_9ACTN|nr:cytochrome P450 [Nonomuraea sp. ATCC 55076]AQZ64863.1 cytochrome [Nonomuraea sp. ATCC 55076]SPL96072.1 putative cytochrome P450 hydroxylase [Actinomadura parvosata subsp. kistnae]
MSELTLPTARQRPLDPPDEVTALRQQAPIHRMTYADGHQGWLVTGYAAARAVLAGPHFSNRPENNVHPPIRSARMEAAMRPELMRVPPGFFLRMDAPEHTRYRKLLTGQFTVRRMKMLEPRIQEITETCLDAMEAAGPPVDLVQEFALPIPSLVICELLGVPYEDRDRFQADSKLLVNLETKVDDAVAALGRVSAYLHGLIQRKRKEPADDLLSGLLESGELADDELTGVGVLLLIAGHETTANMLGLGTYALLTNPAQLAAMRDDPSVVENGVEELLRYLTIIHLGPIRTALEDVEIEGVTIKAGESVTIHLPAANRDASRFPDAERLDVTRPAGGHLTFGHGIHQCLGQQLARAEMRIAYPALLRRLPGLRLAVTPEEVPMRSDMTIYGVHRLPVTW